MKKLPTLRTGAREPDPQAENLERWLQEWSIARALDEGLEAETGSPQPPPEGGEDLRDLVAGTDPDVAAGQIRLLTSHCAPADRPFYVAVLEAAGPGEFLCAPFGPFGEPGVPGEWRTGRDAPGLRVLCLWNSHVVPAARLAESWVVDTLSPDERERVMAVCRFVQVGETMPPDLVGETGPPVIHPADPRWLYREQEAGIMTALGAPAGGLVREGPLAWYARDTAIMKAAEARPTYGRERRFEIVDYHLFLVVARPAAMHSYTIHVLDPAGEGSRRMDGGYLVSIDGRRSIPIWMARTWVDTEFVDAGFVLFDDTGTPLPLSEAD